MIVQNVATERDDRDQLHRRRGRPGRDARRVAEAAARAIGAAGVTHDAEVAKVSVVGLGHARRTPASPRRCSRPWPTAGINIQMITTSEIKISVLVDRDSAAAALRAVHKAFELERPVADAAAPAEPDRPPAACPAQGPRDRERHLDGPASRAWRTW